MTRIVSLLLLALIVAPSLFVGGLALTNEDGADSSQRTTLRVEHSIDGKSWKARGQLSFRPASVFHVSDDHKASSGVSFQQEKLSTHDIASLEELSASEGNYRVRIGSTQSVFASVPACRVLASNFVDQLTVHMSGSKVIGISYHVDSNDCVNKRPSSSAAQSGAQWTTSSRVDVGHDAPRPNLDPTGAGKPVTAPGGAPPQQVQEEPGFFAKYWHYLLPIPVMIVLSGMCGGEDDKNKKKPAGQSAQQAGRAPAASK